MRSISIAGIAQLPSKLAEHKMDAAELVQAVTAAALADAGIERKQIGFVCSGSSDYIMGQPFSFVMALDGVGAWPPIRESHVEMDGAWALYEAWVRLQHGDIDTALVYAFGKSSVGPVDDSLAMQLDPYYVAPLGISPMALAALQARALLDARFANERDFAQAVMRARLAGARNPNVPTPEATSVDALLAAPYVASPLRAHDAAVRTDGAAAIVLRAGGPGPKITGFAHRIEPHALGVRDLTSSPSARRAADDAGASRLDVAEIHTPYASQEIILRNALGLNDRMLVNPSGGTLVAETPMVAGLTRVVEATRAIRDGAHRALAHATSGPCLQHNLVCVLEST